MHQAAFVCETHRAGCPDFQVGQQDLLAHSALVAEGARACAFVATATLGHEVVLVEAEVVEAEVVESDPDLEAEVDPDLGLRVEW